MNSLARALLLLVPLGLALGAGGCSSASNAVDCHSICTRYADCFVKNYDVNGCESRCRNNADTNGNYRNDMNSCNACIDDRSCASATFNCASPCSNVVP